MGGDQMSPSGSPFAPKTKCTRVVCLLIPHSYHRNPGRNPRLVRTSQPSGEDCGLGDCNPLARIVTSHCQLVVMTLGIATLWRGSRPLFAWQLS